MYCEKCGTELNENEIKCNVCGADIDVDSKIVQPADAAPSGEVAPVKATPAAKSTRICPRLRRPRRKDKVFYTNAPCRRQGAFCIIVLLLTLIKI